VKRFFFLLNAAFAMGRLDLISCVSLKSHVIAYSVVVFDHSGDGCFKMLTTLVFSMFISIP
jgi:hypothetical protein